MMEFGELAGLNASASPNQLPILVVELIPVPVVVAGAIRPTAAPSAAGSSRGRSDHDDSQNRRPDREVLFGYQFVTFLAV